MAENDDGSVAAEFAVAMPVVLLMLALCVSGIQLAGQQLRLQDAAADAARSLGRGEGAGAAQAIAARQVGGARLSASSRDDLICARLTAEGDVAAGLLRLELSASSCALGGGL